MTKRTAKATIRLVVVHDHPLVRKGLAACLGYELDMEVVSATTCGPHVLDMVAELRPDLVLMQRSWGGIETARRLTEAQPGTRVAILSATADAQCQTEAARSGAVGVVDLTAPPAETADLLRRLVSETSNSPAKVDVTTVNALAATRARIASYLHDVVVEDLARVALALSQAASQVRKRGRVNGDGELLDFLDRVPTGIRDVVTDLRTGITILASPALFGAARQAEGREAVEADVRRIVGDLHDGVVQHLVGIHFELRAEASRLVNDEAVPRDDELAELFERCAVQIRATVKDLRLGPFWGVVT